MFINKSVATILVIAIASASWFSHKEFSSHNNNSMQSDVASDNSSQSALQWKRGNVLVNWKDAYEYCESLASREGVAWRLPSVLEIHREFPVDFYKPPTDNYVWSALINQSGVHYTVNLDNGAKQWRGDDVLANILCIQDNTWDRDAWKQEVYNATATGRIAHMVKVVTTEANKGNAEGQLELGNLYIDGRGVPQNDELAARWYQKAADQGLRFAELSLAEMRRVGRLTP